MTYVPATPSAPTPTPDDALLAEIAALRLERNRLRDALTRQRADRQRFALDRLLDGAHRDALALLRLAALGLPVGRSSGALPRRRWAYAVALLRMARLTRRGRDLRIVVSADAALDALDLAIRGARMLPSAYARHVPPSLRPLALARTLRRP